MTRIASLAPATACLLLLTACGSDEQANQDIAIDAPAANAAPLTAALVDPEGNSHGTVTLSEDPTGVTVKVEAKGLAEGPHGLHLHESGRCTGPDFKTAGAHWNPSGREHGRDNPAGAHLGDLANLSIGPDGTGTSQFLVARARMLGGDQPLVDGDGAALVVHAKPDDYKTDPSGESGDRIACAAFTAAP